MKSDWTVLVLVGVVFLIGTVVFWRALLADENENINETTTAEVELIARHLESELNNHVQVLALVRLVQLTRRLVDEADALNVDLNPITRELQESDRGLEEFAYVAFHDLKTPLVALQGMADVLTEDYGDNLPEEGQLYLHRIKASASKMQNLLDDVLRIPRMRRYCLGSYNR